MKKALVTGIIGQDGAYLAELLLGKGLRGPRRRGRQQRKWKGLQETAAGHALHEAMRTYPCARGMLGRKAVADAGRRCGAICADTTDLARDTAFDPTTPVETGVACFVEWYKEYHRLA